MPKKSSAKDRGDFGLPPHSKQFAKTQVVGIFDLVGFTTLGSNKNLVNAVKMLESQLSLELEPTYYWAEPINGRESYENNILLRSTGDGYILAFSEGEDRSKALRHMVNIHTAMMKNGFGIRLGINEGENYVVADINNRVNIIGWGINFAARALQFAEKNQIICTSHFAERIINANEIEYKSLMLKIGTKQVKNTNLELYNYHKNGEFGAELTREQFGT